MSFLPGVQEAMQTVWDYMHMHHELRKADAIMVLGSYDTNVGVYAAQLYLDGWAPLLVCAGSGSVNQQNAAWADFAGSTEAEVFADIAVKVCTAYHALQYDLIFLLERYANVTCSKYLPVV